MAFDVAFSAEPTHETGVTYGKFVKAMHSAVPLLHVGANVNLINDAPTPQRWTNNIANELLPRLLSATKQRPQNKELIMLHAPLEHLCTRAWFVIAGHLAVNMLLFNAFIDLIICVIFPSKGKAVPWHFPLQANLNNQKPYYSINITQRTHNYVEQMERIEETWIVGVAR